MIQQAAVRLRPLIAVSTIEISFISKSTLGSIRKTTRQLVSNVCTPVKCWIFHFLCVT